MKNYLMDALGKPFVVLVLAMVSLVIGLWCFYEAFHHLHFDSENSHEIAHRWFRGSVKRQKYDKLTRKSNDILRLEGKKIDELGLSRKKNLNVRKSSMHSFFSLLGLFLLILSGSLLLLSVFLTFAENDVLKLILLSVNSFSMGLLVSMGVFISFRFLGFGIIGIFGLFLGMVFSIGTALGIINPFLSLSMAISVVGFALGGKFLLETDTFPFESEEEWRTFIVYEDICRNVFKKNSLTYKDIRARLANLSLTTPEDVYAYFGFESFYDYYFKYYNKEFLD